MLFCVAATNRYLAGLRVEAIVTCTGTPADFHPKIQHQHYHFETNRSRRKQRKITMKFSRLTLAAAIASAPWASIAFVPSKSHRQWGSVARYPAAVPTRIFSTTEAAAPTKETFEFTVRS